MCAAPSGAAALFVLRSFIVRYRRSSVDSDSSPTSIVVVVVSSDLAVLRVVVLTTPRSSIVLSVATAPSLPPVSRVSSPLTLVRLLLVPLS